MITPDITVNLQKLREAAAGRDWLAYHAALPGLLVCLPAADAVEFALAQLRAYLPRFERYHPDVTWPRQRLRRLSLAARGYPVLHTHLWLPESQQRYDTPGSDHFVQALERVWQAAVNVDQSDDCLPHLVAAIVGVRLADLEESWFGPRPGAWEEWRLACQTPGGMGHRSAWKIGLAFDRDPATQQRDTAAWLAVADELERRITAARAAE